MNTLKNHSIFSSNPRVIAPIESSYDPLSRYNGICLKSNASLLILDENVCQVFDSCQIDFNVSSEFYSGYECSTSNYGTLVEFNVYYWQNKSETSHIVDVFLMSGCRFTFGTIFDDFIDKLNKTGLLESKDWGKAFPKCPPDMSKKLL